MGFGRSQLTGIRPGSSKSSETEDRAGDIGFESCEPENKLDIIFKIHSDIIPERTYPILAKPSLATPPAPHLTLINNISPVRHS